MWVLLENVKLAMLLKGHRKENLARAKMTKLWSFTNKRTSFLSPTEEMKNAENLASLWFNVHINPPKRSRIKHVFYMWRDGAFVSLTLACGQRKSLLSGHVLYTSYVHQLNSF